MDIISHGLWGGVVLGRKRRIDFIFAFAFSVLPDIFAEGIMFLLIFLGLDNMPGLEYGHPDITDFPVYAQNFYNTSHSLIVFIVIFTIAWIVRRKAFLPLAAWGIHILIDIPTHSYKLFPTPFLWPVSDFKIDGISWDSPVILIPDIALLIILYSFWFYKQKVQKT
jgi:hypothetical protein